MTLTRRIVSAVLAIALAVLGVVILIEIVLRGLERPPALIDHEAVRADLATRPWDDPLVILAWAVLLLLGLALLAVALAGGRARTVELASGLEGTSIGVRRRSLERHLAGVAVAQPGVRGARAAIRRGSVRVRAEASHLDVQDVRERVEQAVGDRVRSLEPVPGLTPTVVVRSRGGA
jgi:hypothetical protein